MPILSVYVTREQWQTNPKLEAWATYQPIAYALLFSEEERWEGQQKVVATSSRSMGRSADNFLNDSPNPSEEQIRLNPQAYLNEID